MKDLQRELALNLQAGHAQGSPGSMTQNECRVFRCYNGCGHLITIWQSRVYGGCPRCGNAKMNGAYPHGWEWVRIWWWNFFKRWQVHGPEGHGWNVQSLKAEQIRVALRRRQEQGL
jgi:hypothetical protein